MDPRAEYLIQILEKIGAPLMGSITAASKNSSAEDDAKNIAALLAKTVQASIDIGNSTDLSKAGVQDDSLRVALAALASPMVAEQYKQDGKVPTDQDLKKITTALQAVMSFSENFTPSPDNTERLKDLAASGKSVDAHQVNIQYIHAFIPIVNAIGGFSFGQSEQKLIMDVSSKLVAKAASLGRSVLGDLQEEEQKLIEVALLRSLSEIYAQCHDAETKRLMSMNDEERSAQPQAPGGGMAMDSVWTQFDLRVAMLEAIAQNSLPAGKASGGSSKAPAPAPQAPVETVEQPKDVPPPPETPPSAPLEAPEETPSAEPPATEAPPTSPTEAPPAQPPADKPPAGGNPMSMFAKPKGDAPPPAAETPAPETPPAAPQEPPKEQTPPPPADTPPTPPPAPPTESPPSESDAENKDGESGGNPMAFFKGPPKSDDG